MRVAPLFPLIGMLPALAAAGADRPNVLLIVVDDMGYSDLGCYGGEIRTPNIDRLAAQGMRFTGFYSNPMSAPTRASLLTGLYQTNAGIGNMGLESTVKEYQNYLRDDCATLAETFREAGYATCHSGKWHLGSGEGQKPCDRGFGRAFSMLGGATDYYRPQGMYLDAEPWSAPEGFYMTHEITRRAVEFIDGNGDKPLMMYVAYNAPHWPLQAPRADIDRYDGLYDRGWAEIRRERFERMKRMGVLSADAALSAPDERASRWDWDALTPAERREWADKMEIYAAMVDIVDRGVGQIVAALERRGALDNTIIVLCSDNGACAEGKAKKYIDGVAKNAPPTVAGSTIVYQAPWANVSATPHWKYKKSTFNGGINVPMVVRYPAVVAGGGFCRTTAHVMDVMPTLLDLAGVAPLKRIGERPMQPFDGVSMRGLLEGGAGEIHDHLCWEHRGECAVIKGKWKLVYFEPDARWSLYDLSRDGGVEIRDLSASHPEKVDELKGVYRRWMADNHVLPYPEQLKLPLALQPGAEGDE